MTTHTRALRTSRWPARLIAPVALALFGAGVQAQPDLSGLTGLLASVPEGSWVQANLNQYQEVWTPAPLRPLNLQTNPTPEKIIIAWSSFSWDSKRGDLILYGGGHANYSGNDVYRWRGTTRRWERASLPSEITLTPNGFHTAIDGVDNAPVSAHTYDNSLYLPVIDRMLTFGGASYNTGNGYARPLTTTTSVQTGPYLFDPSKADGNKVGGSTGSHVQREGPYAEIVGGNMWTNRDVYRGHAIGSPPSSFINGMTAYAQENGRDVVYVVGRPGQGTDGTLYRYTINDLADVGQDTWQRVGAYWNGPSDQGAGAYDPIRKLFVRTGPAAQPITFWDLNFAAPDNRDRVVVPVDLSGGLNMNLRTSGIEFDPVRNHFMLWGGGGDVWRLVPPTTIGTAGWTMQKDGTPVGATPTPDVGTGVLGKFKYIQQIDAYIALQDPVAGNVWLYKPVGWRPTGNVPPTVSIRSPLAGQTFPYGTTVTFEATASDADGSVARVEFYIDGTLAWTSNGPIYSISMANLTPGTHTLVAVAVDDQGARSNSQGVTISVVGAPNTPPTVNLSSPSNGASIVEGTTVQVTATAADPDGSIASVALQVNGTTFATLVAPAYTAPLSGLAVGTHVITATATDNLGATTTSAPVTLVVTATGSGGGNAATTVTLQQSLGGYTGTRDNFLSNWNKTENNGGRAYLYDSGAYVDLVRFAVFQSEGGPVPDGATITSARLSLYKASEYDFTYQARRMLVDWSELESTWQRRTAAALWAAPGAAGAGSDYAEIVDATASVGYSPGWLSFDVTAGMQALSSGEPNYGWRLLRISGNGNEKRFASREFPEPSLRPKLTVSYVPGRAPEVSIVEPSSGERFAFGSDVTVSATASDADGTVVRVDFYVDDTWVASANGPVFNATLSGLAAGTRMLTAVATDDSGARKTSTAVPIQITGSVATATLQDGTLGYSGTRDTFLSAWNKDENKGTQTQLYDSGAYVDLVRFAIFQSEGGPVPDNAVISSAQLSLYKTSEYDFKYEARRMVADWIESEATWNRARVGVAWASPGANSVGTDFLATSDAAASVGYAPGWLSFDVTGGVQAMATGVNRGWRLLRISGNGNEKRFASREFANAAQRPKLVVTYTIP